MKNFSKICSALNSNKASGSRFFWVIILVLIILFGAFLRTFHFSDWLHFQLDQSRDAELINYAYQHGAENLPLLGPRAGGSFLRLGPIFYYFEFLSVKISGFSPGSLAYVSLFFGILTIPLFYFFVKNYFNKKTALALTALIASSFYLIMYSRFAWNPNPLPFFSLLFFWSVLKTINPENPKRGLWLILASSSLAIAGQLHFLAFVAFPVAGLLIFILKKPRIPMKYWLAAGAIFIMLYSPAILNDVLTGGKNFNLLMETALNKTEKSSGQERNLAEKAVRNIREFSYYSGVVLSGYTRIGLPKNDHLNFNSIKFKCKDECTIKTLLFLGIISFGFFVLSIIILIKRFWQERNPDKKNFLLICLTWLLVSFFFFVPLSFDLAPRFFLVLAPLFFILLGIVLVEIERLLPGKKQNLLIFLSILILIIFNLYLLSQRFSQLSKAPYEAFNIGLNKVPKEHHRVTLQQQEMIIQYIQNRYQGDGKPVFINSEPFYERAFFFHLDQKNIPRDGFDTEDQIYEESNYYMILPVFSNTKEELLKVRNKLLLQKTIPFGTLNLYQLSPKETASLGKNPLEMIQEDQKSRNPLEERGKAPQRYSWKEAWEALF
jgi:4-amino-4-deoxy-L-arabinose transferase-like glycosyltransferase